jgi:phosphinothricin acetyltransferase
MKEVNLIREAEMKDAEAIAAIYAPHVTEGVASFEAEAPDAAEMRDRIRDTTLMYPWLVCEKAGEVIGYAYAGPHNSREAYSWSVNVTVYVERSHQRAGVGRALYSALFELLRLQGFFNAYAGVTLPNPGSVRLHESLGFKPVGIYRAVGYKFGAWRDVSWWGLELQEKTSAEPPLPLAPDELFGE